MNQVAKQIINESIQSVLPDKALKEALANKNFHNEVYVVAIGKAAYTMAKVANETLKVKHGIVITKYKHLGKQLPNFEMYEAGHPIVDENSLKATAKALELTNNLTDKDTLIFLVSGGGSALFEQPLISLEQLQTINEKLLKQGANIKEVNTIRKRLSKVKGGRFAEYVYPAKIEQFVLSDVVGDYLDVIASGPAYPDSSNKEEAILINNKYHLGIDHELLNKEPVKELSNVNTTIIGNLKIMCDRAFKVATFFGYDCKILTYALSGEAKDVAKEFTQLALKQKPKTCLIMGGETTVTVKGNGLGGRNTELALTAAKFIKDKKITIFSLGSDGTDGPTDAAGGIVDGQTYNKLLACNINIDEVLNNNDSYNALKAIDGLIITGPTGTNVNDLVVALID